MSIAVQKYIRRNIRRDRRKSFANPAVNFDIIAEYMDAVVLLRKPEGITSFDAVSRCRRILHERKAGHTGTLDPNASGLLILLFGRYTKYLPYCVKDHKSYHATFTLGTLTDTGDIWGNVLERREPAVHSEEEVRRASQAFLGDIQQIPPMYSALKVNGRKLYELARKGESIERKPRPVHVSGLEVSLREGVWHMDATVSSGTYIRTLITDLGEAIGEYAAMSSLVRYGIEHLSLEDAVTLEQLEKEPLFLPPVRVLDPAIPLIELETKQVEDVIHGRAIHLACVEPLVILKQKDQVLAAYERRDDGRYHCQRGLL